MRIFVFAVVFIFIYIVEGDHFGNVSCFPGAIYRKALSEPNFWQGIEGEILLPFTHFDESRKDDQGRYLDNPSIYMGGTGGEEIDTGLSWEVIKLPNGTETIQGEAFRPFWRGELVPNGWGSAPDVPDYYYYPGDLLTMSCKIFGEDILQLNTKVIKRGTYAIQRHAPLHPPPFTTLFNASGFSLHDKVQLKRVNSIDQSGNEDKPVQPTTTEVLDAAWNYVMLIHKNGKRVPMIDFIDFRCPSKDYITIRGHSVLGGEIIDINKQHS